MQRLLCGIKRRPFLAENEEGCQSFAPGDAGQISRITLPRRGAFSGLYWRSPVLSSTPVVEVRYAYALAERTSPVVRSRMYKYPLRSGRTNTFLVCPLMGKSRSMFSLIPS